MTTMCLKEQKAGQGEAASARRQVHLVQRGRSAAGGLGNLLWPEKRVDLRVCATSVVMAA